MEYRVKLEVFEGPLDLLLHLIEKSKVDIKDVSITEITDQYLDYLFTLQEFDLEIASEFLVMAATLIQIKSKSLLPITRDSSLLSDSEELDTQQQLIERLIQYKKFKEIATKLREYEKKQAKVYFKTKNDVAHFVEYSDIIPKIKTDDLLLAYKKVISSLKDREIIVETKKYLRQIKRDAYTIKEKKYYILKTLKNKKRLTFNNIIKECSSKLEVIISFLAILELIKDNRISLSQSAPFNDILIEFNPSLDR